LRASPDHLAFEQVDAPFISAFLSDLEMSRGVSPRTRNLRLTAIRSFFEFAAYEVPDRAAQIQRVLVTPNKRFDRKLIHFLTRPEVEALLKAPDKHTWNGRREEEGHFPWLPTHHAMSLLHAGFEQSVIALWMGHASPTTTQV
jgi:site-specific recombinase XerD